MKKLFRSNTGGEGVIKQSLLTQLSDTVKQIQYFFIQDNELGKSDDLNEAFNHLCVVIEAMFLHGLRDSISRRLRRAIADVDERPEPSFWPPLLIISHRQMIEQITNLPQINTEVGMCRAWIRIALNDGLLSSYFVTIRRDTPWKSFYQEGAFVRDSEVLDLAQRLLEGVEEFKNFSLPYNSSILNLWTAESLCMAGVWAPTMKASPVAPCDDVASMVEEAKTDSFSDTCSLSSALSVTSLNSGLKQMVLLNEDDALKIILAKGAAQRGTNQEDTLQKTDETKVLPQGNSVSQGGWSSDNPTKSNETSYNALLASYNQSNPTVQADGAATSAKVDLSAFVCQLSTEQGLQSQGCKCATCHQTLSVTSSKPRVCAFTSQYFCDSCMGDTALRIPVRIIHKWDFKTYPVSKRSCSYLNEIQTHPVIDLKEVNVKIYEEVKEMRKLLVLRNQLNFIRAYLYTCREPIINELKKKMTPREYMYEHIHLYSFSDLCDIPSGLLAAQLKSVVDFGRDHVVNCWLCSQKGFLCEICNKSQPLFPFDVELVYRCDVCYAVYHKECLNAGKPCPKCKRKKEREDIFGATVDD